jgi:type I restriction enzyme S subunit
MREGWVETTAGDIAFVNPETAKPTENSQRFRYVDLASVSASMGIDIANLEEYTFDSAPGRARRIIREGDVLISTVRPYLRGFAIVPPELDSNIASTGFTVLRADDSRTISDFVWAITRTKEFVDFLMDRATGSNYPAVRPKDISDFPIALPPLAEQRRIVDVIESVDNYITALETRAETARTARSALLHDLLSNPGPHWTDTTLGDAAHITNGGTPSTENLAFWGGTTPWITTTELSEFDGKEISSSRRTLTPLGLENGPARLIRVGSTLLGTTATIGTSAIASAEISFNQQITGLTPKDASLLDRYLFNWTQNSQEIFQSLAAGTSFKRISTSNLRSVQISVPPLAEQRRIVDVIESVDRDSKELDSCLHEAQTVRSALLSDLLSGNHEIPASYDQFLGAA